MQQILAAISKPCNVHCLRTLLPRTWSYCLAVGFCTSQKSWWQQHLIYIVGAGLPMGARPASIDLQAFWRALPDARIDLKTNCLVLLSGVYFMGDLRYGSKLLYRQHYGALWQQAVSYKQEGGRGFVVVARKALANHGGFLPCSGRQLSAVRQSCYSMQSANAASSSRAAQCNRGTAWRILGGAAVQRHLVPCGR